MSKQRLQSIVDVHVIFVDEKGQWLFSQRANTGYKDGQYSLVAGHLEPGESLKRCAAREAQEEAGVSVDEKSLELVHVMRRDSEQCRMSIFFLCKAWSGQLENREREKCSGFEWRHPTHMPTPTVDYIAHALTAISNGESVSDFTPT